MTEEVGVSVNPLRCGLCLQDFVRPVRLPCQHCFCMECAAGCSGSCPLCGAGFARLGEEEDRILIYLLESSKERTETCANCDEATQPMFFCDTCQTPLCQSCQSSTHQAKIFSSHQIVPLGESGRSRGQSTCPTHKAPFILFCQETKSLMCIECFNGSSSEKRNHFVSIDVARKLCRERLNESVGLLKGFQSELQEQVGIRRKMLLDIKQRSEALEQQVEDKFRSIVDVLSTVKGRLNAEIEHRRKEKECEIERQLRKLSNADTPIRLNLLSASVFCSSASTLDLLHLFPELLRNMKGLLAQKMERAPLTDDIRVDFVTEFRRALDDLPGLGPAERCASPPKPTNTAFVPPPTVERVWHELSVLNEEDSESSKGSYASYVLKSSVREVGGLLLDVGNGGAQTAFAEHLQKIDGPLKQFSTEVAQISKQLLDVQKDITLRRCLVDKGSLGQLQGRCESLNQRMGFHATLVEEAESALSDFWTEQLDQLRRQHLLFHQRKEELASFQRFSEHALATAQKLLPLCSFLASVISVVDERRTGLAEVPPMEQICMQILTLTPDSKQRCRAIEKEEENRRQQKEKEKHDAVEEVKKLPRSLKETPRKPRPVSVIVIENSRDRPVVPPPSSKRKKGMKRSSLSDDGSELTSPRGMASPAPVSPLPGLDTELLLDPQPSATPPASPCASQPAKEGAESAPVCEPPPPPLSPPRPDSCKQSPCPSPKPTVPPKAPHFFGGLRETPSDETVRAREKLLQSIKEKVKRID